MVCIGKGGLVGYGLIRIGSTGIGVSHARHAQLARMVARLVQIGHHDGRTCGVLVHGHARLAILRGVLGDIEAKGTCAVERHGRSGFGAKGERGNASRLGRAGDSLVSTDGDGPVRYCLLCGLTQASCAGVVRSGSEVKGIALALVPVATAHGLLTLKGHARGLHAICISKGGRSVVVQLLYRTILFGLVVFDRSLDAGTLLGIAHHGVIDRFVVGHARNAAGNLSKPVHVGTSRIRLGGIRDIRPSHRAIDVANVHGVAFGALGHGGRHALIDRIGVEHRIDIRIATHALERKGKSILGKRERPGVVD